MADANAQPNNSNLFMPTRHSTKDQVFCCFLSLSPQQDKPVETQPIKISVFGSNKVFAVIWSINNYSRRCFLNNKQAFFFYSENLSHIGMKWKTEVKSQIFLSSVASLSILTGCPRHRGNPMENHWGSFYIIQVLRYILLL